MCICNNQPNSLYTTQRYSNLKVTCFGCTNQSSSGFTFQKIHQARTAETCSFLDYYNKTLCTDCFIVAYCTETTWMTRITIVGISFLCFLHRALWYSCTTWTNKMHNFQINTLIRFVSFWGQKLEKLNWSINLKNVHFVGSCCTIRYICLLVKFKLPEPSTSCPFFAPSSPLLHSITLRLELWFYFSNHQSSALLTLLTPEYTIQFYVNKSMNEAS